MSTAPDNEFDLEKLFLPAWAQEPSSAKYADYEGGEERPERRGGRDRRGPRREGAPFGRPEGNRPRGERRGPPRGEGGRGRGPGQRGPGGERPGFRRDDRRDDRRERREPPAPLPEIELNLIPEEKGVESLARQIKMTGRAYPLFDIAQLILQKPERHVVSFKVKKNPEGAVIQPLFVCALDDTLWLSEDEAVSHVLRKHFATFYQAEKTAAEPPKGKYTFVAQCGLSGVILGPPNHHDYQNQLRKLHAERFSRMPFEVYKSRVRIVKDEEVVKKWIEDQSWKTEYLCLNMPEPLKLATMEQVEKHFRETHKENIIKPVESYTLNGTAARNLRCPPLSRLVRNVWEDQRRFPLQIATVLSQQFATHGLQFFKVNKAITHVSVARPHYLDVNATPVSEGIKQIVEYINTHPKSTRRQLIETLAPSPAPAPIPVAPAPAAPAPQPPAEGQPAPEAQPAAEAPKPEVAQPTPEQNAVIADLHWLVHQGHVIEFANGILETAKKPVPKPPKPPKAPEQPAAAAPATEATPPGEATPAPSTPEPGAPVVEPVAQPEAQSEIVRPADQEQSEKPVEAEATAISRPAEATTAPEPEPSPAPATPVEPAPTPASPAPAAPPLESP